MNIREYLLSEIKIETKAISLIKGIFVVGQVIVASWMLYFTYSTVTMPYPIEYREAAAQVMNQILLDGGNPFSLEYQPLGMNNYGIVYSLIVYPLAVVFGNKLLVYRLVSVFSLVLIFLLVLMLASKKDNNFYFASACGMTILITLSGRGALGAFPSMFGTFLFLAATLIPFKFSFSYKSLLGSALISALAYFTKPYFVLSFAIVASYVFLFVSKKKGLFYILVFILIFGLFSLFVRYFFELYFIDTLFGNISNASRSPGHLYMQLLELAKEYSPIIILGLITLFLDVLNFDSVPFRERLSDFHFLSLDQPFIPVSPNYFIYFFFCSTLAFVLVLGFHTGSYMSYAYQLMIPPLLLWLFQRLKTNHRWGLIALCLILCNTIVLSFALINANSLDQRDSKEWKRLYGYLNDSTHILNSPVIASAMIERGMLPVDSGQTEYYYKVNSYPDNKFLGPTFDVFKSNGREYKRSIIGMIKDKSYDRVILTQNEWVDSNVRNVLEQNYLLQDSITVVMPQTDQSWVIDIWVPKTE